MFFTAIFLGFVAVMKTNVKLDLWLSWMSKSNFQQIENQREKNHGLQWIENYQQKSEPIGI
jgi:hypothetical protein